jgi:hypothetical protein
MGEQPAELVDGVDGIEPDGAGIDAHPGAGVEPARPRREVVGLQRLEQLFLDSGLGGDFLE